MLARSRTIAAAIIVLALIVVGPAASARTASAPNIVLILLDDMRWDYLRYLPVVRDDLMAHGVTFRDAYVENPMCCPSRSTILTGNASHTTDVFGNAPPHGGYETFHDGPESSTIAIWLDGAGYHTGLIGKYLNGYGPGNLAIPPGWDRWVAFDEPNASYYNYDLNVDGTIEHHGAAAPDYSTDVLGADARHFILDTPEDKPLFLYFAPFGPHAPTRPAPRDVRTVKTAPAFAPSVDEADVRDKPRYVRKLPTVPRRTVKRQERKTIETLASENDAVRALIHALKTTGRLGNTVLAFASDNGYLFGEHRIVGKQVPYEESIRIPLVIRDDALGAPQGSRTQLVVNTDLAPTFAELAGIAAPPMDGTSLVPILLDPGAAGRRWFLFEHYHQKEGTGELDGLPSYCGIRTRRDAFIRYASGFEELYDLRVDPFELRNVADDRRELATVRRLRGLARTACSPLPPDMAAF